MNIVVGAVLALGTLGLIFGIVLAIASRFFHVDIDERIEKLNAVLPGANCGGCGYPGCIGYAEAIVNENVDATLCAPGGSETAEKIAEILGIAVEAGTKNYPIVHCQGSEAVAACEYDGVATCAAAGLIQNGFKVCAWACLGLGDCARVCPVNAISTESGIAEIDETICISCGKCAAACPKQIISMRPEDMHVHVRCLNQNRGKAAKQACPTACIACKKCEKACPFDAIHIIDNIAVIDYDACKNCGKCVKECPMNCIVNLRKERRDRKKPAKEKETVEA